MKTKLPLITKKARAIFPQDHKCPVCSKPFGEPNSFACIMGGAMKQVSKNLQEMDSELSGFLNISFYSSYSRGKGPRGGVRTRELVVDSWNGQFDIYFCSIPCMKKFFDDMFDEMEAERIKSNKRKIKK